MLLQPPDIPEELMLQPPDIIEEKNCSWFIPYNQLILTDFYLFLRMFRRFGAEDSCKYNSIRRYSSY